MPPVYGESNGRARLTKKQVIEIRRAWQSGKSRPEIAKQFSVHRTAVSRIIAGSRWPHVEKGLEWMEAAWSKRPVLIPDESPEERQRARRAYYGVPEPMPGEEGGVE